MQFSDTLVLSFVMDETVEFVYNARLRRRSLDTDLQSRLAAALLNDIQRDNIDQGVGTAGDDINHDEGDEHAFVPEDDASDIEEDMVIEPNELSDSEDDDEEREGEEQPVEDENILYGKDGTQWSKNEPAAARFRQHNITCFQSGPKQRSSVPIEVFKQFFSPNISLIIITETIDTQRPPSRNGTKKIPTKNRELGSI